MFWNQSLDSMLVIILSYFHLFSFLGGYGDWSSNGCNSSLLSDAQVNCYCDHLTHFTILQVYIIHFCFNFINNRTYILLLSLLMGLV